MILVIQDKQGEPHHHTGDLAGNVKLEELKRYTNILIIFFQITLKCMLGVKHVI